MSKLDEIVHDLAEDVADEFGGDIDDSPQEGLEKQAKQRLKSCFENIDPDLPYDIMYFFTDSVYADYSLDEKVQLVKDRIDEYHKRIKEL